MKKLLFAICLALPAAHALAHGAKPHTAPTAPKLEQKPWGIAGTAKEVGRTLEISMSDTMRFSPDAIRVALGETVRFKVRNAGGLMHEMVIGTPEELAAHASLMQKYPNMEHDEPYMAHVAPKETGDMIWTFNRAGHFEFACLVPGHFTAGMKGVITVSPGSRSQGEIRRIDEKNRKITLKHGPIKHLDMPPMTMVFHVAEGVDLKRLKVGDMVSFMAEAADKRYAVSDITPAQ